MFDFLEFVFNSILWGVIIACLVFSIIGLYANISQQRAYKKFEKSLRWWSSSCGKIEIRIPIEWAESTHHSGHCDNDVLAVSQEQFIRDDTSAWNPDIVANILREYASWDEEELKDKEENIQRLLWIACGDIAEQEFEAQNPDFN